MPRRLTNTPAVSRAARRNITKAQVSRVRLREPRSIGRVKKQRTRSVKSTGRRIR